MKRLLQLLKKRWSQISRKKKVLLYSIGILISAVLLYSFIGAPADLEQEFRRAEKANLVGPGKILGSIPAYGAYSQLLIADDGEGIILYPYGSRYDQASDLRYREKTGNITLFTEPQALTYDWERVRDFSMTIGIVDAYPQAVRAELTFTLQYRLNDDDPVYEKTYTLESHREIPGLFAFQLAVLDDNGLGVKGWALEMLMSLTDDHSFRHYYDSVVPVTVRLYDQEDTMLCQESMELVSYARQVHIDRGED